MGRFEVMTPSDLHAVSPEIRGEMLVGRSTQADWRVDEPSVSRRHAQVRHRDGRDEIEDLGSTGGTRVNGVIAEGAVALRPGDVVQLAGVRLRYVAGDVTQGTAAVDESRSVAFEVGDQRGQVVSNVARDQYNNYVQHVVVQRDDALRQVAGMNKVARVLVIFGFALAGAGVLGFIGSIVVTMAQSVDDPFAGPQFVEIAGVPAFAVTMGVALVGFAFYLVGVVVQMSARKQRRQVDRDYPLPAGWPGSSEEW